MIYVMILIARSTYL